MKSLPPELLGLLQACKDAPEDNEPRLVLSDWLEEHGDPDRAEYVRLQALTRDGTAELTLGPSYYLPEGPRVEARLDRLKEERLPGWLGPLAAAAKAKRIEDDGGLFCLVATPEQLIADAPADLPGDVRP
jgi:uncharacterized protein (TIGR02996 family)